MKFLHTGDWQIGMRALQAGSASSRVREARVEAARRVIEVAGAQGVEFVLVAGDTFENNGIDRPTVQKIGDILGAFNGPVYVIPGNHDSLEVGCVWEHPVWSSHPNIHVAREAKRIELRDGFLYPCPVFGASAKEKSDPTLWVEGAEGRGFRIGLAHGSVQGPPAADCCLPIARESADRADLDYLALGHWHSTTTYADRKGNVRMAYSGTHEPTSFGERNSGNVLVVTIDEPGAKPDIELINTGLLRWEVTEERITEMGQLGELRKRVEAMGEARSTLIRIRLTGLLFAAETTELTRLEEIVFSRFLHGEVEASPLMPAPNDDEWVSSLPGFLRAAGMKLRQAANSNGDGRGSVVAARALRELYMLKQGVSL